MFPNFRITAVFLRIGIRTTVSASRAQQPGSRKQPAMTGLGDQRQDGGDGGGDAGGGTGSVTMACGGGEAPYKRRVQCTPPKRDNPPNATGHYYIALQVNSTFIPPS
jgi:hypothetical protein